MFFNPQRTEVIYDAHNEPRILPPRCLYTGFDGTVERYAKLFEQVLNPRVFLEKASSLLLIRHLALGDVLMLIPVVRQLREAFPNIKKVILNTSTRVARSGILQAFNEGAFDRVVSDPMVLPPYDLAYLFDGLLEQDHYTDACKKLPRVTIYQRALCLKEKFNVSWSATMPELGTCKEVVFCSGGTTVLKQLPLDLALGLVKASKLGITKHIRYDVRLPDEELVQSLRNSKVCITVDSSVLWMAHFTRTPVVFISGPTRAKERLAHHPLRPDGFAEVSLSKEIGCEPCFESVWGGCSSQRIRCMRGVQFHRLYTLVREAVEKVAWKTR